MRGVVRAARDSALVAWVVLLAACTRPTGPAPASVTRPDIFLVTVDTLRADRVTPSLTPVTLRVGADGLRFSNARTVAPLTLPAHASLLTGAYPPAHGVRLNGVHRFDGRVPTLATLLHEAGYQTGAFVGAYVLDRAFGLAVGFDEYDDHVQRDPDAPLRLEAERRAGAVVDEAVGWLRRAEPAVPVFVWVHLYDPHAPYDPPREYLQRAAGVAYDGEVAYADSQVGRLLEAATATGRPGPPLVAIVGDHGESLGEHGERTHGMLLYEAAVRVPLVLSGPGVPRGQRSEAVSIVDLAPTLLTLAGLPVPASMPGTLLSSGAAGRRPAYSETEYPRSAGWSALAALTDERWKVIESSEPELFDLARDPHESANLHASQLATARAMAARLASIREQGHQATPAPIDQRAVDRLRSLGYVAPNVATEGDAAAGPNPALVIADWVAFEDVLSPRGAGATARAVPVLAALAAKHPDSRLFHAAWARALQETGQTGAALAQLRVAAARWPGDATLYHDLATAARAAGHAEEAARAEQAALAVDDRYAPAHNGLGLLATDRGRHAEARAAFERAAQLDATNATYWVNLGNACRAVGESASAERAYRQAMTLAPSSPDAANGLGVLLVQADRPGEAIALFERALAAKPDLYEAWLNLGIANQEAGRVDAARVAYRKVLEAPASFAREREAARALLSGLPRAR